MGHAPPPLPPRLDARCDTLPRLLRPPPFRAASAALSISPPEFEALRHAAIFYDSDAFQFRFRFFIVFSPQPLISSPVSRQIFISLRAARFYRFISLSLA